MTKGRLTITIDGRELEGVTLTRLSVPMLECEVDPGPWPTVRGIAGTNVSLTITPDPTGMAELDAMLRDRAERYRQAAEAHNRTPADGGCCRCWPPETGCDAIDWVPL